jgi:Fe-S cluster assembly iron-binding protein IscA
MIRLTERAEKGLQDILASSGAVHGQAVKLVPDDGGGIAMTIDRPGHGDAVVSGHARPLLIVDASLAARLSDVVLDFTKGNGHPPHFVLVEEEEP